MGLVDAIIDIIKAKQDGKDSQVVININGNNMQNCNNRNNKEKNTKIQKNYTNSASTNKIVTSNSVVSLEKIRLYCSGAKGKVYTTIFRKDLNNKFGVEVVIKNNTSKIQTIKLGHCIYNENGNNTIFKRTLYPRINPYSTETKHIIVDTKVFAKMKKGKYKAQFWINDKKAQKVFFMVQDK